MTRISIVGHPSCSLPDNDLYGKQVEQDTLAVVYLTMISMVNWFQLRHPSYSSPDNDLQGEQVQQDTLAVVYLTMISIVNQALQMHSMQKKASCALVPCLSRVQALWLVPVFTVMFLNHQTDSPQIVETLLIVHHKNGSEVRLKFERF